MKIGPGIIKYVLLYLALLLCAPVEYAGALTYLSLTKDVTIDADWRISGQYACEFKISQPDDARQINNIIRQFEMQTDQSSQPVIEARLPDGRNILWKTDGENDLPAGTSVRLMTTIAKDFPGFAELFADYLHIDQESPVKTASYRITFPQKTAFTCRITQHGESRQNTAYADFFAWSGDGITNLDLILSTATSWEQIARRYRTHFQNRLGEGVPERDFPEKLRHIDVNGSPDEKVRAVMNFLKNDLAYRSCRDMGHALLPDDPATVLHRGWGDCKDFALLAAALLREMDIETFVVLTGTPRPHCPGEVIPDPFLFDHALLGFRRNGETAYYDCLAPDSTVALNNQNVYLPLEIFNNDHR